MKKIILIILAIFVATHTQAQNCVAKIYAGQSNISFQKEDGTIYGCGRGELGALANGTGANTSTPIAFPLTTTDWDLQGGVSSTYAIKSNHTLWGAGYNAYGALGIGSTVGEIFNWTQVGTASNWLSISGAGIFTIALQTNGTLWGWGDNHDHQMGGATTATAQLTPIQIGTDTNWKEIETGDYAAFGIKTNGTLWGWGFNVSAILMGDSSVVYRNTPYPLTTDTDWKIMSAGIDHVLAIKTNGTLWSWGSNDYGQMGSIGTGSDVTRQVGTATNWVSISAGDSTSYGIKSDGTLWAWGKNNLGQLGIGMAGTNPSEPVQVGTSTHWVGISASFDFAVGLQDDGSVYTWGSNNDYGQLANGGTTPQAFPTNVLPCTPMSTTAFSNNTPTLTPNPAHDTATLTYKNHGGNATVEVYDLAGRLLNQAPMPHESYTINTSSYPSGIYIVVVKEDGTAINQQKLIKK